MENSPDSRRPCAGDPSILLPTIAAPSPSNATMTLAFNDLRYALRGLVRSPLFSIVAILSLALGIGANTAIFTLIDQILLRKLPVAAPESW